MESLSERFNALQDQLMNIYEAAEQTLQAQIKHWQTLRKEAVLLYYAREKGVTRLGYQPVPVKAVSETKAKEAIAMVLQLESLQTSDFAHEPWTLVDTSTETFRSAPEGHFKKGPVPVEVIYDNDPDNANLYTMWTYVYYMDADDKWHKARSGVNHIGIYYLQGTFKNYYVLFADDAKRYGTTGEWEVKVNKDTVFAPVTSSTPPGSPGRQADTDTTAKTPTTSTTAVDSTSRELTTSKQPQQTETRGRRYGRRPSSKSRRSQTQQRRSRSRHRSRSRSRSRSKSQTHTTWSTTRSRSTSVGKTRALTSRSRSRGRSPSTCRRGGGRSPRRRSRSPSTYSSCTTQRSQRARAESPTTRGARGSRGSRGGSRGGRLRRRGRSSSSSSSPAHKRSRGGSAKLRGVSPGEVGGSLRSVSSKHTGRLGRLLEEARDPPVIIVKGAANTLKCFRNRAKIKYTGLFRSFSTTWSWVAGDGTERLGRPRMLISFSSYSQRKDFDEAVRYPKGVDKAYGNLDSL